LIIYWANGFLYVFHSFHYPPHTNEEDFVTINNAPRPIGIAGDVPSVSAPNTLFAG